MKLRDQALVVRKLSGFAEAPEDGCELVLVRAAHQHLVLNAAEKRFVAQLVRFQIGGKDQEGFERNRNLAAAVEFQVVHAPFHGNNPAVQHFGGRALLAAEIVDQVNSIIGF